MKRKIEQQKIKNNYFTIGTTLTSVYNFARQGFESLNQTGKMNMS